MKNKVLIVFFIFSILEVTAQNIDSIGYINFSSMTVKHSLELINKELEYKLDTISSVEDSIIINNENYHIEYSQSKNITELNELEKVRSKLREIDSKYERKDISLTRETLILAVFINSKRDLSHILISKGVMINDSVKYKFELEVLTTLLRLDFDWSILDKNEVYFINTRN